MFDWYPIVSYEGTDMYDISDEVTLDKLIAWLESKPEDYLLHGVSGRMWGSPTGCLIEEYVNDLLGVTTVEAGWINGVIRTGDWVHFTWHRTPNAASFVHRYDSLRHSLNYKSVSRDAALEMLRQLQSEG